MARLIIRVDISPKGRLGPGKIELLERIAENGSIAAAGRSMGMSYRRAWELVSATSAIFGSPVVEAQIGGRNGGNAKLTELGAEVVSRFRTIEREAEQTLSAELEALQAISDRTRPRQTPSGPRARAHRRRPAEPSDNSRA